MVNSGSWFASLCHRKLGVLRNRTTTYDESGKLKDRDEFNDDEKRLLDLLAQGLSRDFPNPQRIGCPGSVILRGIAFRKLRLSEVSRWLDHLSSCSPCFQEFTEMHKEVVTQRRLFRGCGWRLPWL